MSSVPRKGRDQLQLYWQEQRKIADANKAFLDLVAAGMTRADLEKNIERRPELWSRFSNWLDKLPV